MVCCKHIKGDGHILYEVTTVIKVISAEKRMMLLNYEYVEKLLLRNDVILIDTASLMEKEGFARFIDNYYEIIIKSGKRITIPEAVYLELQRHLVIGSKEKIYNANTAINLLRGYQELFDIEMVGDRKDKMKEAFADQELLIRLTEGRRHQRQLLITNDRNLSKDAFALNALESCRGEYISVCYINSRGELHRCECTKAQETESIGDVEPKSATKTIYRDKTSEALEGKRWKTTTVGACAASFIAGICINRYGKTVVALLSRVL